MLVSGELAAEGGARRNGAPASRRPPHALLLGFQQQDKGRPRSLSKELPVREAMEFVVVIVGAGPAGLAAAIRLKQLDAHLSVVVLEKGSEVGAHIPSGAVIDPIGLDQLTPEWRTDPEMPLKTLVSKDRYLDLDGHRGHSPAEMADAAPSRQSAILSARWGRSRAGSASARNRWASRD